MFEVDKKQEEALRNLARTFHLESCVVKVAWRRGRDEVSEDTFSIDKEGARLKARFSTNNITLSFPGHYNPMIGTGQQNRATPGVGQEGFLETTTAGKTNG